MFGNDLGLSSQSDDRRAGSGIYLLWNSGALVYVGQAVCVFARAAMHCKDKDFDRSTFMLFPKSDLDFVESYFIWFLRPSLNKQIPLLGKVSQYSRGRVSVRAKAKVLAVLEWLPHELVLRRFGEAEARSEGFHVNHCRRDKRSRLNQSMLRLFLANREQQSAAASR